MQPHLQKETEISQYADLQTWGGGGDFTVPAKCATACTVPRIQLECMIREVGQTIRTIDYRNMDVSISAFIFHKDCTNKHLASRCDYANYARSVY